jgi:hypothetical protein
MRKEARVLHAKAVDSLVLAVDHFNRSYDRGRCEAVLILMDRAFELLLKAIIVHKGGEIRERKNQGVTIGFDLCLRKCLSDATLKCVSEDDAVALQSLNSLRDAAQHYVVELSEEQLYVYAQMGVTLFTRLAREALALPLRNAVPVRVLPISPKPPQDLGALFDLEFADIKRMVAPGSRKRLDARAKLRSLAILQASLDGRKSLPSDAELDQIVRRINAGEPWRAIFPGVATLAIEPDPTGPGLSIRITRSQGEAVQTTKEGDPNSTVVAVKTINAHDYFSLGLRDLARKLKVTQPKLLCLILHDKMQHNPDYYREFKLTTQPVKRYSPKALDHLHRRLGEIDLEELWSASRAA